MGEDGFEPPTPSFQWIRSNSDVTTGLVTDKGFEPKIGADRRPVIKAEESWESCFDCKNGGRTRDLLILNLNAQPTELFYEVTLSITIS